jgi:hypothetical protein
MPAEAGTQVTWQQGLGMLQNLSDPKGISDLGPRLRGDECVRDVGLSARWESLSCEVTSHVAEGNCVAARRGGEQPQANEQPAG